MPFIFRPGSRLQDVLIAAISYARTQEESARFTINHVRFIVTKNSNLVRLWVDYYNTRAGETVGPCEGDDPGLIALPGTWSEEERAAATDALGRLRAVQ